MGISNWMVIAYIPYQSTIALLICAICIVTFMLYAPLDTPKYKLTHSMAKKEKLYSILIILIEFLICIVLKNKLSVSILYSDICVYILFVLRILITSPFLILYNATNKDRIVTIIMIHCSFMFDSLLLYSAASFNSFRILSICTFVSLILLDIPSRLLDDLFLI